VGMTAIDGWRAIQYHHPSLKLTVEDYADALAWDCVHNPYSKTLSSSPRTYIEADAGSVGVSSHQQSQIVFENQRDRMRAFMDLQMDLQMVAMEDRLQNMEISTSAGRPSNESALSTSTIAMSAFAGIDIGDHDPIPIDKKNKKDGRPVKRRCCICGMDTRSMCSSAGCRIAPHGMLYGRSVCKPNVGARKNLPMYPGNTLSCLQLHRNEIRQQKLAEYKGTIANRPSA
jgi:hypothetical protein